MSVTEWIGLREDDPQIDLKRRSAEYLGLPTLAWSSRGRIDAAGPGLLDASSMEVIPRVEGAFLLLAAPQALPAAEGFGGAGLIPYLPLRNWGIALKARQMREGGTCGELASIRFSWCEPRGRGLHGLADAAVALLDTAVHIGGATAQEVYIERVAGEPIAFGLARLEGNIAVEIEINFDLPSGSPPIRQLRANFKEGVVTNMPIVGLYNEEGAILADDSGVAQLVIDDADAPSFDEFENLYWKTIHAVVRGENRPEPGPALALAQAAQTAFLEGGPVAVRQEGVTS